VRVEVRLFATLAKYRSGVPSGEPFAIAMQDDATLGDLLQQLAIPPEEIHLAMVAGRIVHDRGLRLKEGQRVGLFPPVGGG
jgi:molybdopterin converting factor small subunit